MESNSAAYWILTALAAQFTVVQYGIVFAAVLRLRYSQPKVVRGYTIPGGKPGVWINSSIGILACLFGFLIVFIPPVQLSMKERTTYQVLLGISFLLLASLPLFMAAHRKWIQRLGT